MRRSCRSCNSRPATGSMVRLRRCRNTAKDAVTTTGASSHINASIARLSPSHPTVGRKGGPRPLIADSGELQSKFPPAAVTVRVAATAAEQEAQ